MKKLVLMVVMAMFLLAGCRDCRVTLENMDGVDVGCDYMEVVDDDGRILFYLLK